MKKLLILCIVAFVSCTTSTELTEQERMDQHAKNTEIIRDDFGVPHIYGKTDADAVFGLLYAQAEDDFNRVERNYIWAIGRLAEVEGDALFFYKENKSIKDRHLNYKVSKSIKDRHLNYKVNLD